MTWPGVEVLARAAFDGRPFAIGLVSNVTIRLLGSDHFPPEAKQQAAADLTAAARDGALEAPTAEVLPLERAAEAHDRVDAAPGGRGPAVHPGPTRSA